MAITISGENNVDKILASDGVIDQLSGFSIVGVITATSFTGDLTGDVTGNLTGNVTGNINNTTLLLQTGGTERLRIDSSGNVIQQSGTLILKNATSDSSGLKLSQESGDESRIFNHYNGPITFGTANAEKLRITNDGNIGFNRDSVNAGDSEAETATTTPKRIVFNNDYSTLETDAALKIYLFNNNNTRQGFTSGGNFNLQYHSSGSSTHSKHTFYINNTERLRIAPNGAVLIGTDNADSIGTIASHLVVGSKTNNDEVALTLNVMEGSNGRRVKFFLDDDDGVFGIDSTASSGVPPFVVRMATSEKLRITSNGKVGINTTVDAATQLQVQSDGTSTTVGGNIVARFQSNGSGRDATIQLSDNVANSATISMLNSALFFKQSGTQTLRITASGLVEAASTFSIANVGGTISGSGGTENWIGIKDTGGNFKFVVKTASNAGHVGKVGINNTNPLHLLHISSTSSTSNAPALIKCDNDLSGKASYMVFNNTTDNKIAYFGLDGNGMFNIEPGAALVGTNGSEPIVFATNGNSEKLRITSAGNVVVGGTGVAGRLEVNHGSSINGATDCAGQNFAINIRANRGANPNDEGNGICFSQLYYNSSGSRIRTGGIVGYKISGNGSFGGGLKFKVQTSGANPMRDIVRMRESMVEIPHDNVPLQIGVDGDLRLRHDGNNSIIGNNTGSLIIATPNELLLRSNTGQNMIRAAAGGEAALYHANAQRLKTLSGGVQIYGNLAMDNNAKIQTGSSAHMVSIQGGATNMGGRIELRGGNGDGDIRFFAQGGTSTQQERMRISKTGVISSAVTRQAVSYTALATPTYWNHSATGTSNQTIDVSSQFGVPDDAKAILVQGWYHITGYSQGGAGQGDHASSHFAEYSNWATAAPWSFTTSTSVNWGQYVMDHDGDNSGSPHYYGVWTGQGIVNVNPNGNIYGRCFWGYSGGTHYNQLWCFGYYR